MLDDLINVSRKSRKMRKQFAEYLDDYNLSYSEIEVIYVLGNNAQMHPSDIATYLEHERANVSRIIKELHGKNLVDYIRENSDRRKVTVEITNKGKDFK